MSRARDVASLLNTVATDTELSSEVSTLNTKINQVPTGSKNLLYNGAMQVAQRGTSTASITAGGYYTADRWLFVINGTHGTWTQSVENDGPTGSGFTKSYKLLCTTADSSPAADDLIRLDQVLEGQDLQRIAKGTASAQELTLSFWVKSNVTGTYVAAFQDADNIRQVSAQYTISASATWEKKTITFPADITGSFDNDNAGSLRVILWLGSGSNRTSGTLRTSWTTTTAADLAVGQTNLAAATNNYWQVTGVQLEVGDTATEFEHLPFSVELARCQRYYWQSWDGGMPDWWGMVWSSGSQGTGLTTGFLSGGVEYPVAMRSTPTITFWDQGNNIDKCFASNPNSANYNNQSVGAYYPTNKTFLMGRPSGDNASGIAAKIRLNAEL